MSYRKYIDSLARYLKGNYGAETAHTLLVRIIFIEKELKYCDYETINTRQFYFIVFYIFKYITTLDQNNIKHFNTLQISDVMDLTLYIIYSYIGPSTDYNSNSFLSNKKIQWKFIIAEILLKTDISKILLQLNSNKDFYNEELIKFLNIYSGCVVFTFKSLMILYKHKKYLQNKIQLVP